MSQVLDTPTTRTRSTGLDELTRRLVRIVEGNNGFMSTRDALIALARSERLPLSRMNYVLTLAKDEGLVETDSSTGQIHLV
jgi:hypothetical protein